MIVEGGFGKAEINVDAPAMVSLSLRGPGGLSSQSLLAHRARMPLSGYSRGRGRLPWARQGLHLRRRPRTARATKAARKSRQASRRRRENGGNPVLRVAGIQLAAGKGPEALADGGLDLLSPRRRLATGLEDRPALEKGLHVDDVGQPGSVLRLRRPARCATR